MIYVLYATYYALAAIVVAAIVIFMMFASLMLGVLIYSAIKPETPADTMGIY